MPGTILVSILELQGLPSVSPSSSFSIKVSVGREVYENRDIGDFYFSLSTLRDKLILKILSDQGPEIAHTAIETKLIVEKGLWENLFALEGGGHVHMKLQFILSEEERNKIRNVRESASRKKKEELRNKAQKNSGPVDDKANKAQDESGAKNLKTEQAISRFTSMSNAQTTSAAARFQVTHARDASSQSAGYLESKDAMIKEGSRNDDQQKKLGTAAKTPSSVRKMVLAFESSSTKGDESDDGQTMTSAQLGSVPSKMPGSENPVPVSDKKVEQHTGREKNPASLQELQKHEASTRAGEENVRTYSTSRKYQPFLGTEQLIKLNRNPHDEISTDIKSKSLHKSKVTLEDQIFSREQDSFNENKGSFIELTQNVERPEESYMRDNFYSDRFNEWIFLNEAVCSCIATDSKVWPYEVECCSSDLMIAGIQQSKNEGGKSSRAQKKVEFNKSPAGSPKGHRGQAIKIAIMVGFGILVLFTRQRQPR